jgi:hypothetical protein
MNFLKKIFKSTKAPAIIDPLMGKTVIHFTTHGCQATIHEFDYIGKIVDTVYPRYCDGKKFYKVEILKGPGGEKRDGNLKENYATVPSWYLQDLGGDFLIAYD